MDERLITINKAAQYVKARIGGQKPLAGIILGSGLGALADSIRDSITIPYSEIPDFPVSTAIGHKGNFIFGTLGGRKVIAMQGRIHYYEGYDMQMVTMAVRVMRVLGIDYLFVSNAAGGCNPSFNIGDLMIIADHINMLPNPLIGKNMDEFGIRFTDMTCAYSRELIDRAEKIAAREGIEVRKGVYLAGSGPSYETPAEIRFFKAIGADAIGMSTIPEVIVARHCGIEVFGMSVISNICNTDNVSTVLNDGDDVVIQANRAAAKMCRIFSELITSL